MKCRILCYGRVQGVGFRALVKQVARELNLKGEIRNLENEVEIFAEGNKNDIESLILSIDIRDDIKDNITKHFYPYVERIEVFYEGGEKFCFPDKEFKTFDIDYGRELNIIEKENTERGEIAILILSGVRVEIKRVGEKVDNVASKVDNLASKVDNVANKVDNVASKVDNVANKVDNVANKVDNVANKVDNVASKVDLSIEETKKFANQTNENFTDLGDKYHVVSQTLLRIADSLETKAKRENKKRRKEVKE